MSLDPHSSPPGTRCSVDSGLKLCVHLETEGRRLLLFISFPLFRAENLENALKHPLTYGCFVAPSLF